jgi:uracil-DNA glycosylase
MKITPAIEKSFGDWVPVMRNFIESPEFDKIFAFLKSETGKGKKILPAASEVFKSYRLCSRHKVRAIAILQCPYATLRNNIMIADGIPMNCKNIHPYTQPSLYQWWQAIEKTYGFDPDMDQRTDLSFLLEEEGVLLINSAETVELQKVDSHSQLWEPFTRYVIEEVLNKFTCGLPIVLMGTQAQKFEKYINPLCHHVLKVEHPAAASYANREWDYKDMFEWCNKIIEANNGPEYRINWMRKKGETKKVEEELPSWVTEPMSKTVPSAESLGLPWKD